MDPDDDMGLTDAARGFESEAQATLPLGRAPVPSAVATLPARLGRYTLLERLGAGGMAEVFLAKQDGPAGFEKTVVIKRILPHLAENARFVEMFLREAKLAAMLSHTNLVHIHELGEVEGCYFLAMEHVDGLTLHRLAKRAWRARRSVPMEVALGAIADAALGLHCAHELTDSSGRAMRLVHRDISPDNLIINREGVTKVLDFGIAKGSTTAELTRTGELKGKIPFMSPEQMRGEPVDRRTDLYSLGVSLYWLLTGRRPHVGANEIVVLQAVLSEEAKPPSTHNPAVPAHVDALVMRLLSKGRERRHASGAELFDELASVLAGRRTVIAPYVGQIMALADDAAAADDEEDTSGFLPSTPLTEQVRADWRRLTGLAAPSATANADAEGAASLGGARRRTAMLAAAGTVVALALVGALVVAMAQEGGAPPPVELAAVEATAAPPSVAAPPAEPSAPAHAPPSTTALAGAPSSSSSSPVVEEEAAPGSARRAAQPRAAVRPVSAKAPSHIRWLSEKGQLLGTGTTTLQLGSAVRAVTALDPRRGGRTKVTVEHDAVDYLALPKGKVQARAYPYAEVFLGQEALGMTPFAPVEVVAGTYELRFVHEGRAQRRTVVVGPGRVERVNVDFEAR